VARSVGGQELVRDAALAEARACDRAADRQSLGNLLEGCRQYLLAVASDELRPELVAKAGASDLVQETLLDAHRDFAAFRGTTHPELLAWLRRILLHHLATLERRYLWTQKRRLGRELRLDDSGLCFVRDGLTVATQSPSSHAVEDEKLRIVQKALDRLPEQYVSVIHWRNQQRCSFRAIAERLGISEQAARQLWVRAIRKLRKEIVAADDGPSLDADNGLGG
jgi:RNA polymerase sigma-70 factor (ECF subfamily)